jgi:hypothetical protein
MGVTGEGSELVGESEGVEADDEDDPHPPPSGIRLEDPGRGGLQMGEGRPARE